MSEDTQDKMELSEAAKKRIERNRQKALAIKQSKLVAHPYAKSTTAVSIDKTTIKIGATKYKDTGGGFLLEEQPEEEEELPLTLQDPPVIEPDRPTCLHCKKTIATSWLLNQFDYPCCDECKTEENSELITKTEAIKNYYLKECDFERREPPLKFITRKNPHNVRWGEMKLFLLEQVKKRALEVWGSEEAIEEQRELREEKRVMAKSKKYQKELKELRMQMRSSLYDRTTASHTHEFGEETYNEEDDTYSRSCQTCSYQETFEKM